MRSDPEDQPAATKALTRPRTIVAVLHKAPIAGVLAVPWIATLGMLATGRIWANGDNLIQSYPLRVLTGFDLHHGHLPLWDPFIWSGTPLLAGFNAGAAYPPTLLFAFLPPHVAWVINQSLPFSVAAAGIYVLLRYQERSELASTLAAASFSLGGFMVAQNVHLDLLEGASWLPWAFVAIDRIARANRRSRSRTDPGSQNRTWPWVLLLAASSGLMILAGAPEAPLDSIVPLCIYAGWSAICSRRPTWRVLGAYVLGAAGGIWLSAAQWLPGLMFQLHSQRAPINYGYFTSGSLRPVLSILSFAPYILGGTRSSILGYPSPMNLVEAAGYTGILTMVGAFALIARWRHEEAREWRIWFVIAIVGLLLAWGGYSPLGIIMYHLPGYNKQRLLSRNLLEVDLAACVLFAYWCDSIISSIRRPVSASATPEAPQSANEPPGGRLEKRLSLIPVAVALVSYLAFLAFGPDIEKFLGVMASAPSRSSLVHLDIGMLPWVAVVIAAGLLASRGWKAPKKYVAIVLSILVLVDLSIFNLDMVAFPRSKDASNATAKLGAVLARAAGNGRVAIYDPKRSHFGQLLSLSSPDLNILRRVSSVQGYGAIVSASYNQSTHSHTLLELWPAGLEGTTFDKLDLRTLLSPRFYFMRRHVPAPSTPPPPAPGALAPLPPAPTSFTLALGTTFTWYFGKPLHVTDLSLPLLSAPGQTGTPAIPAGHNGHHPASARGAYLKLGLLIAPAQSSSSPHMTIQWVTASEHVDPGGTITVRPTERVTAVGLVALAAAAPPSGASSRRTGATAAGTGSGATAAGTGAPGRPSQSTPPTVDVGIAQVTARDGVVYFLDGELQGFVTPSHWLYIGSDGSFAMFRNTRARGRAWLLTSSGAPAPSGHARVVSQQPWGTAVIDVAARAARRLVWSEAYATGWSASMSTGTRSRGPTTPLTVHRNGLLQEVAIPAGRHVVTFRYQGPADLAAIATSLAAVVVGAIAVLVGAAIELTRRRTRKRTRRRPERATAGADPS